MNNLYSDVARDFFGLVGLVDSGPSFELLTKLTGEFGRLPYENLTKIIRAHEFSDPQKRMRTPDIVFSDHIDFGTGGTCFSLTVFFEKVLLFAGFDIYPVLCDRSYGPATHCAIIVRLNGKKLLIDPGYLLMAPLELPIKGESIQNTQAATTKLVRLGLSTQYLLFTKRRGTTKLRYRMKDVPIPSDVFEARWIDSFDWAMMRHICVSKMTQDGQLYMRDGIMRGIRADGESQKRLKESIVTNISSFFKIVPQIVNAAHDYISCDFRNFRKKREAR